MEILYDLTLSGSAERKNEDTYGHYNNYAWVIDGATNVFNTQIFNHNDTAYMVERINESIIDQLKLNSNQSIQSVLLNALKRLESDIKASYPDYFSQPSYQQVSFTIAMIRVMSSTVEYYILGDCTLVTSDQTMVTDTRIRTFSNDNTKKLSQGIENRQQIFQSTRKKMNTPSGYWVGSIDGCGIKHGIEGVLGKNQKLALYTDGFEDLLNNFSFQEEVIFNQFEWIEQSLILREEKSSMKEELYGKKDDLTILIIQP